MPMGFGYGYAGLPYGAVDTTPVMRAKFAGDEVQSREGQKHQDEQNHTAVKVLAGAALLASIVYGVKHPDKIKNILKGAGKAAEKNGGKATGKGAHKVATEMPKKWFRKFCKSEEIATLPNVKEAIKWADGKGIKVSAKKFSVGAGGAYKDEATALEAIKRHIGRQVYAQEATQTAKEIGKRHSDINRFINSESNKKFINGLNGKINKYKNECKTVEDLLKKLRADCPDMKLSVRGKGSVQATMDSILEQFRMQNILAEMKKGH